MEETLDPADWNALRALGHQILDDMFTRLETLREGPTWLIPGSAKGGHSTAGATPGCRDGGVLPGWPRSWSSPTAGGIPIRGSGVGSIG